MSSAQTIIGIICLGYVSILLNCVECKVCSCPVDGAIGLIGMKYRFSGRILRKVHVAHFYCHDYKEFPSIRSFLDEFCPHAESKLDPWI